MRVAEKLKNLIESRGITYTFISKETGIPANAISRSFLGKRRLAADEMVAICKSVGLDLKDLASDDN